MAGDASRALSHAKVKRSVYVELPDADILL